MTIEEAWEKYRASGQGLVDDETLLGMLEDLIYTIRSVERIYGRVGAQLLVRAMLVDFQVLSNMAGVRGLQGIGFHSFRVEGGDGESSK